MDINTPAKESINIKSRMFHRSIIFVNIHSDNIFIAFFLLYSSAMVFAMNVEDTNKKEQTISCFVWFSENINENSTMDNIYMLCKKFLLSYQDYKIIAIVLS